MYKSIGKLAIILISSTFWIYLLYLLSGPDERLKFPTDVEELKQVRRVLHEYKENRIFYTVIFFSSVYLYKQTFAIPGSVFLNLLSGSLFGLFPGFFLICFLSSVGASLCYLTSKYIGKTLLEHYFPAKIANFREIISKNDDRLFKFLISLRIFPMTPNWLINMVSPIVNIPLKLFFPSVLIGLLPYNFLTTLSGVTIAEINSLDDVMSCKTLIVLVLVSLTILKK